MVSKLALGALWGYQTYISPHKGFRCAYLVLHGGTGCSGFAKHAIRDVGLWRAIPSIGRRLRACKSASLRLWANCAVHANWAEEQADKDQTKRKSNQTRRRSLGSGCGCGKVAWCGLALPAFCATGSAGAQPAAPDKMGTPVEGGADGCAAPDCSLPGCDGCGGCDCSPSC